MRPSSFRLQVLGLLVFFAVVLATFLVLVSNSGIRSPLEDPYEIAVALPNAANLAVKGDVRTGGVRVGQVDKVRVTGTTAVAELSLDEDSAQVFDNALVQLRYKSALNEGYVDLDPGGGPDATVIADGGTVPLSRAAATVQIDQVLSTLDAPARRSLQRLLGGASGGLKNRGEKLNRLLRASGDLVDDGDRTFAVLADQRMQSAQLVDHFGQVTGALGARKDALRLLARRARTTAVAVAARGPQLRQVLDQLPGTLDELRSTSGRLGAFSATATPAVADLRRAMTGLEPAIRGLTPAARAGRVAMRELGAFEPQAERLLKALTGFGGSAAKAMPGVDGLLRQLTPLTRYLSSQRSNLTAFFSNYTAATDTTDAVGHVNKLSFLFNRNVIAALVGSDGRKAIEVLENAGVLSALSGKIQRNAYPDDGNIGRAIKPFSGTYPRLTADPPKLPGSP